MITQRRQIYRSSCNFYGFLCFWKVATHVSGGVNNAVVTPVPTIIPLGNTMGRLIQPHVLEPDTDSQEKEAELLMPGRKRVDASGKFTLYNVNPTDTSHHDWFLKVSTWETEAVTDSTVLWFVKKNTMWTCLRDKNCDFH